MSEVRQVGGIALRVEYDGVGLVVRRADGEPMDRAGAQHLGGMIGNRVGAAPSWYRCTVCGGDFDTRELLARHEVAEHGKDAASVVRAAEVSAREGEYDGT